MWATVSELKPDAVFAERFEVVGTLGRGGTATVYLTRDRVRGEAVALKVLHPHLAHDPAMRRRLRREVRAASLVRSDAALVATELFEEGGTLALSMPMHAGTTLSERVRSGGPLAVDEIRVLAGRLSSALGAAHRVGVLHRDVSPNNVMLEQDASTAQLTDFGLARTVEGTATATSVMGTPGYAAPETFAGQRTDPRSDLYGMGATLFFAATGQSPFGSRPPAVVLAAQLAGEQESLARLRPDLPEDLARTIESLLAVDPSQRPPSAREVGEAAREGRQALVPQVPDTWNPASEPLVRTRRQPAVRADLPVGEEVLVLTRDRQGNAQLLADNVNLVLGLPPGSVQPTRPMSRKGRFQLIRPTDAAATAWSASRPGPGRSWSRWPRSPGWPSPWCGSPFPSSPCS